MSKLGGIWANNAALFKQLLNLALPITIGGCVQLGYHLINSFWVGRLGAEAVAVISICIPVNLLLISLGSGLSMGASILIAQNFGARNTQQVNHIAAQILSTMIVLAVVLSIAGIFATPAILQFMHVDANIFVDAVHYLRISFASLLFLFLSTVYQSVLRGVGETKSPLRIIISSVILNAALDPLLIFGWGPIPALGVGGAAYATLITQLIASIFGIRLMLKPQFGLTIKSADLWPDWPLMGRLFRIGVPASIEQSMQALTVGAMTLLAAKFGTVTLASYGMAFRIITFLIIPPFSISMASSILVGQSIGAGNLQQPRRIALVGAAFNFAMMSVVSLIFLFAAKSIVAFFVPSDAELIAHCAPALRIFALSFGITAVHLALSGAFRGGGATLAAMLLTIVGAWGVQVPSAYVMSQLTSLGEFGLWWATPVAAIFNTAIAVIYFRSYRWIKNMKSRPAAEAQTAAA